MKIFLIYFWLYHVSVSLSESRASAPLDTIANIEWIGSVPVQWYLPMISKTHLAYALGKYKIMISNADLNQSCIMNHFKPPSGRVTAYGETKVNHHCQNTAGQKAVWLCRLEHVRSGKTRNSTAIYSLTDNKTFLLATFYFDDGQREWVVYSAGPNLSQTSKQHILKHLKKINVDDGDIAYINYDNCASSWTRYFRRFLQDQFSRRTS